MGRHREWRKIAKRERRRKNRIMQAQQWKLEHSADTSSNEYKTWVMEQEYLEKFEVEEIQRQNNLENEKWLKADAIAVAQWNKLQEKLELSKLKCLEEEIRVEKEWENEQIRRKEAEEKLQQIQEENNRRQRIFMEKLEQFLSGDSYEPPEELLFNRETKPNMEPCPFFAKTASCRFGDLCSRNHKYPGISKILLATNFYIHFGLENSNVAEYEDVILENEDSDTYKDFKDFFNDVLPEFEKYGEVINFKVCHNYERHLRGNTYVEFSELRCAVSAYRALHTRWYAGRQISLQFCNINTWKNAICGLYISKRCPKGRACNFLHVFRNPTRLSRPSRSIRNHRHDREKERMRSRSWRWSESPEPEVREHHKSRKEENSPERKSKRHHTSRRKHNSSQVKLNEHYKSKRKTNNLRLDTKEHCKYRKEDKLESDLKEPHKYITEDKPSGLKVNKHCKEKRGNKCLESDIKEPYKSIEENKHSEPKLNIHIQEKRLKYESLESNVKEPHKSIRDEKCSEPKVNGDPKAKREKKSPQSQEPCKSVRKSMSSKVKEPNKYRREKMTVDIEIKDRIESSSNQEKEKSHRKSFD